MGVEVEVERDGEGEGGYGKLDGFPHINGRSIGNGNGHVVEMESLSSSSFSEELNSSVEGEEGEEEEGEEEEEDATTPKVDKGKRKAEPEPEMVLSPQTFMMGEPKREEEKGGYSDDERGLLFLRVIGAPFSVFVVAWDEDLMCSFFFLFYFIYFYKLGVLGRGY